jgi:hypothetical protein
MTNAFSAQQHVVCKITANNTLPIQVQRTLCNVQDVNKHFKTNTRLKVILLVMNSGRFLAHQII